MDPKEEIKSKIDIVPFIQEFIPLKQMGRNFKTACPFHGEKTPSFVVSPERQIWHCFGCQKGGDVFTFLMEYEKMDFVEALRTLAKRTGVQLQQFTGNKADAQREKLLAINHLAAEFYHFLLTTHKVGERAREYLEKRGISEKTITTFKLGFAPEKWELLVDYLIKKKGFDAQDIEDAGLIIKSQRSGQQPYYDRFRNRIMFTLRDHRGNVVGFAGRLLDKEAKEAKYVNTPETPLYHKGELLFGLDVTKEAIKKEDLAIVVEGEFDMIQSFQAGVSNIVALKGTAFTLSQVKLLARFTKNIAFALDMDLAGDAAARRSIEIADSEGLHMKVIRVTDGKDPDEVIHNGGVGPWKKAIKEAVSVYDFFIDSALTRFNKETPEGKQAIADEVLPSLSAISNEIVKEHFVKRLSSELDVSQEAILRQMEKLQKPTLSPAPPSVPKPAPLSRGEVLEEYLISLLLQKADKPILEKVHPQIEANLLKNPVLERILHLLMAFYEKNTAFSIDIFVKEAPKELVPTIDRLYLFDTDSVGLGDGQLEIERTMRELRILLLRRKMEYIAGLLKEKEKKGDEKTLLLLEEKFHVLSDQLHSLVSKSQTISQKTSLASN